MGYIKVTPVHFWIWQKLIHIYEIIQWEAVKSYLNANHRTCKTPRISIVDMNVFDIFIAEYRLNITY